jgi:hypothetical protein
VKLEDEFVITPGGATRISTYPFSDSLM